MKLTIILISWIAFSISHLYGGEWHYGSKAGVLMGDDGKTPYGANNDAWYDYLIEKLPEMTPADEFEVKSIYVHHGIIMIVYQNLYSSYGVKRYDVSGPGVFAEFLKYPKKILSDTSVCKYLRPTYALCKSKELNNEEAITKEIIAPKIIDLFAQYGMMPPMVDVIGPLLKSKKRGFKHPAYFDDLVELGYDFDKGGFREAYKKSDVYEYPEFKSKVIGTVEPKEIILILEDPKIGVKTEKGPLLWYKVFTVNGYQGYMTDEYLIKINTK